MRTATALALLLLGQSASAEVTMPAIFGDGMVLQRNVPVSIWGRADEGEIVTISMEQERHTVQTGPDGNWIIQLAARPVGAPQTLVVQGDNRLVFEDVLFGEVWIGAGQSNMGLPVRCCRPTKKELQARSQMRLYQQKSWHSDEPEWQGAGSWVYPTPEVINEFSGALYFFGLEMHETLEVPVGLIQISLGGTRIESWTSSPAQFGHPRLASFARADDDEYQAYDLKAERAEFDKRAAIWDANNKDATPEERKHKRPRGSFEMYMRVGNVAGLFNGKVAPLIPYTIKGVIWYQGENNAKKPELYHDQLTNLIQDWRRRWGQGDFPFAWVQLPNFAVPERGEKWPEMREAMRKTLQEPNTGMVIALDIGQSRNIHPWNKRTIGKRFADWALGSFHGMSRSASGPLYASHQIQGDKVTVAFTHTYGELKLRGEKLTGFELLNAQGAWHAASAVIEGLEVIVSSTEVQAPVGLRFNWSNDPKCTLFGARGTPASPFTTE